MPVPYMWYDTGTVPYQPIIGMGTGNSTGNLDTNTVLL